MRKIFITAGLALPLAACSGTPPPAGAASAAPQASYFTVPAAQMAHLTVVPVTSRSWETTASETGTVDWDNDHTTQVITQVGGPVTRLAVDTGTRVKAGDPLLYVASPDLTAAVSAYRKARNRLDLAKRTLDRSRDLYDHKAIAQRDLEAVQADYNDAATDVQDALQALKIYGVDQSDLDTAEKQDSPISPELALRAPIEGTVVQRLVLPGQVIEAGTTVAFVISDVSTVWVQGRVYEKDLGAVRVGDKVDVHSAATPVVFHGTVTYIDHLVDPATRTTMIRVVTPNTNGLLKKDLFVDLVIHDKTERNVLTVPTSAVLYDADNMPFVYVQMQPGQFAQRTVTLGAQQDDEVAIEAGLKAADRVVSEGSLFLQFASSYGR
jgi:membrane fusion protein, heavy metal efflux system